MLTRQMHTEQPAYRIKRPAAALTQYRDRPGVTSSIVHPNATLQERRVNPARRVEHGGDRDRSGQLLAEARPRPARTRASVGVLCKRDEVGPDSEYCLVIPCPV